MEELFAYIFRIYKKFGGNNPSILTLYDSSDRKTFLKIGSCLFVCLFVTEEIPITVSRQAPYKEAWPSPYHYCS